VASDIGAATPGATNLVLNGGTLEYAGAAASVDRLFTVNTTGGRIDASGTGALTLNNVGALGFGGNGPRVLTLGGTLLDENTLASSIGDNGGATAVTKSGAGKWVLTGTNTYSGVTTIANGQLQVGAGGASGTIGSGAIVNSGGLTFNRTGTVTVGGAISGTGALTNDGSGTVILTANNSYSGVTVINAGTLQAGNGGATGQLPSGTPIVNNGLLIYNTTGNFVSAGFNATISGTGNVRVQLGNVKAVGQNTYTGWTRIDPGAAFQVTEGATGNLLSSVVTNNGTLIFGRQDTGVFGYSNNIVGSGKVLREINNVQGGGDVTLAGTNSYTGGTYIGGGGIILGDGINPGSGKIVGNVIFTNSPVGDGNRFLQFNFPEDTVFTNTISSVVSGGANGNRGRIVKISPYTLTLTANNTYQDGTTITEGTLQVGNGGTSGAIGSGGVTLTAILAFNRSDSLTIAGAISGAGSMYQYGSGITSLTGNSAAFTGGIQVTNGSLFVNNTNGAIQAIVTTGGKLGGSGTFTGTTIVMDPGTTLVPGASASVGTLTITGDLSFAGNAAFDVDKRLPQSNDFVVVTGQLINAGTGTVTITNRGTTLQVGDKFTLFSQAVSGGASLTVTSANATWKNDLATDGSVTVLSVTPIIPPTLNITSTTSTNMLFSWTGGYKLQAQTNSVSVGISTNWSDYPGGGTSPVTIPIRNTNGAPFLPGSGVFFRLATP